MDLYTIFRGSRLEKAIGAEFKSWLERNFEADLANSCMG